MRRKLYVINLTVYVLEMFKKKKVKDNFKTQLKLNAIKKFEDQTKFLIYSSTSVLKH